MIILKLKLNKKVEELEKENYQLIMIIAKDISERTKSEANDIMLRKYVTLQLKETKGFTKHDEEVNKQTKELEKH